MPPPDLPETRERSCPSCEGVQIEPTGDVAAATGLIYVKHRCGTCGTAFVFVRKAII
jgi:hypothetical protein